MYKTFFRVRPWLMVVVLVTTAPLAPALAFTYPLEMITGKNHGILLKINSEGNLFQLIDRVPNNDWEPRYYSSYFPFCQLVHSDGTPYIQTFFLGEEVTTPPNYDFRLEYHFENELDPNNDIKVFIRVYEGTDCLLFWLHEVVPDVSDAKVEFVRLNTFDPTKSEADCFLFFDDDSDGQDDRILGMYPFNTFTRSHNATATSLYGLAYADLPHPTLSSLSGEEVALFTCGADPNSLFDIIDAIENDPDNNLHNIHIPWNVDAKMEPGLTKSCFFYVAKGVNPIDPNDFDPDKALQYAVDAGVGRILLHGPLWGDVRRSYAPDNGIWADANDLAGWIDECHDANMLVGAHLRTADVRLDSPEYVDPNDGSGCDPCIHRDFTLALAETLYLSAGLGDQIYTVTSPADWPTESCQRDLTINGEIIQYSDQLDTDPNDGDGYGFIIEIRYKNQSKYVPIDHAAGSTIGHLAANGKFYLWDIATGGIEDWCGVLAEHATNAGFDWVYDDGVENTHEPKWYSMTYQLFTLYEQFDLLDPNAIPLWMESSCSLDGFRYLLTAIGGQIDYWGNLYGDPNHTFKQQVDTNVVKTFLEVPGYAPRQLGWAPLRGSINPPYQFKATPDDVEYILSRSMAYNAPIEFWVRLDLLGDWPNRDANLHLIKWYENLRLDPNFSPSVTEEIREWYDDYDSAGTNDQIDYMLFWDFDDGNDPVAPTTDKYLVSTSLLDIADGAPEVRGFMTDTPFTGPNGCYYVTMWPTDGETFYVVLDYDSDPSDIRVYNYKGDSINVSPTGREIQFELQERTYIQLVNRNVDWKHVFEEASLIPSIKKIAPGSRRMYELE